MLDKWMLVLLIVGCTAFVFLICFPIDFYLYRRRKKLSRTRQHLFLYKPQNTERAAQYHAQVPVDTFTGKYMECSDDERVEDKKREKKNSFARLMSLFQKKKAEQQPRVRLEDVVTECQRMQGYQHSCVTTDTAECSSPYTEEMSDVVEETRNKSWKSSANVLLTSHRIQGSIDKHDGYGTRRESTCDILQTGVCSEYGTRVVQTVCTETAECATNGVIEFVNFQRKPANYGSLDNVNTDGGGDITSAKHSVKPAELCKGTTDHVQAYISRDVDSSDSASDNETDNEESSDNDVTPYNADSDTNIRMRNRVNIDKQLHHAYSDQNMAATTRKPKHVALLGRKRNSVGPADKIYCLPAAQTSQHGAGNSYTSNRSMSSPLIPQHIQRTPVADGESKRKRAKILPNDAFRSMPYIPNEIDIVIQPIEYDP